MQIFIPKESHPAEQRSPMIPPDVGKLVKQGAEVHVETGLGQTLSITDQEYADAGAQITADREGLSASADMVLRLRKPSLQDIRLLKSGCVHVSYLDPFNETERVQAFAKQGVASISMELIPRTTRAQKMDVLSSQASLAGYVSALIAADRLNKSFPMMITPAGTLRPARVFVIGAGVAGLQAIATAKRLGARVEAFDVRPEASEQIESLGAKAVTIDLGETGSTKDGYAKQLTPEQIQMQQDAQAKVCANSDVVITTAAVFGRKAPVLVTEKMVAGMKPGSVIVDMAVEGGGNVEGSKLDEEVLINGVRIVGLSNLPGQVAMHASQMYSANMFNLVDEFWDEETKAFKLDRDDEIIKGCLVTFGGEIVNERLKNVS